MCRLRSLLLVLLLLARVGIAADTTGLYDETMTVTARDDKARAEDIRRALTEVLGRVIAPEDVQAKPAAALLAHATDYVDQYEYRSGETAEGRTVGGRLEVRFDRERVDQALARAGIAVWGDKRPELLVWLTVMDGATSRFIGAEDGGALTAALQQAATRRRLPVILPLLDLTDQANLNAADLDAVNLGRIRGAVWRYETDVALIGTLIPAGDFQWESRWRFVGPGQTAEWTLEALGSEAALNAAVDAAYSRLVRLYAPTGRGATTLEIRVEGIGSMSEGEICGNYLRGLPAVVRAEWAGADATAVSWRLQIRGSAQSFHQMLADSRGLRPASSPGSGGGEVYRWAP
ncbi:MAG: DUF2066 domain-containing protein [Gammaproteobacteria bacterium]|nr:DUF2066 domain-containing protein [Gammaproteobacteria bacterium]